MQKYKHILAGQLRQITLGNTVSEGVRAWGTLHGLHTQWQCCLAEDALAEQAVFGST